MLLASQLSKADDRRTIKSPDFIGRFSWRN